MKQKQKKGKSIAQYMLYLLLRWSSIANIYKTVDEKIVSSKGRATGFIYYICTKQ